MVRQSGGGANVAEDASSWLQTLWNQARDFGPTLLPTERRGDGVTFPPLSPQQPTLSDMTMYEMNFSLLVEDTLQRIVLPEYRQIIVEVGTFIYIYVYLLYIYLYVYTCIHII